MEGFGKFVYICMLDEAAFCKVLLTLMPWPAFYWCASWAGLAAVIAKMGLASLISGGSLSVFAQSCPAFIAKPMQVQVDTADHEIILQETTRDLSNDNAACK